MCDASDYDVGAILGRRVDKKLNVIHYASKTLNSAQHKYATTERECLAVACVCGEIRCDASEYAVGAVVGQRVDKKLNVIHYARKL